MNLKVKRKETILFILTVIILSFFMSNLSNIIFTELFYRNKLFFSIVVVLSLIVTSIFSYLFILANKENERTKVTFVYTFNRKNMSFYDIPHCKASVHARFMFERVPVKKRRYLIDYDNTMNFFGSEFDKFISCVTQEIILKNILSYASRYNDSITLTINDLPLGIKSNFIQLETKENLLKVEIPKNISIESFGRNEEFIRLKSKYGKVEFSWSTAFEARTYYSGPFITVSNIPNKEEQHDFAIEVLMNYECSFWNMFSKNVKEFTEWAQKLSENLKNFDWHESIQYMPVYLIQEIACTLNRDEKNNRTY